MGRAQFDIEPGTTPKLPKGMKLVTTIPMPARGIDRAVVEGDGLPPWTPGNEPWHYKSLDDLLQQWGSRPS